MVGISRSTVAGVECIFRAATGVADAGSAGTAVPLNALGFSMMKAPKAIVLPPTVAASAANQGRLKSGGRSLPKGDMARPPSWCIKGILVMIV